jgi:hypothetical protein
MTTFLQQQPGSVTRSLRWDHVLDDLLYLGSSLWGPSAIPKDQMYAAVVASLFSCFLCCSGAILVYDQKDTSITCMIIQNLSQWSCYDVGLNGTLNRFISCPSFVYGYNPGKQDEK